MRSWSSTCPAHTPLSAYLDTPRTGLKSFRQSHRHASRCSCARFTIFIGYSFIMAGRTRSKGQQQVDPTPNLPNDEEPGDQGGRVWEDEPAAPVRTRPKRGLSKKGSGAPRATKRLDNLEKLVTTLCDSMRAQTQANNPQDQPTQRRGHPSGTNINLPTPKTCLPPDMRKRIKKEKRDLTFPEYICGYSRMLAMEVSPDTVLYRKILHMSQLAEDTATLGFAGPRLWSQTCMDHVMEGDVTWKDTNFIAS